jgi:hypothetical protein
MSKMLNKLVGERDWSAQEVSHILLKILQQQSTRQYSVLDCRPELGHDRHVMIDEDNMARDALSAYKRYKQRLTHVNGGNHLLDVSLLDWLQLYSWDKHTVRVKKSMTRGKPRVIYFFPKYKSTPTGNDYEEYCRVKLMLSHLFVDIEDLKVVDGRQAETFQEAYEMCSDNHTHRDDCYDDIEEDDDDTGVPAEVEDEDSYTQIQPSVLSPRTQLDDYEAYGRRNPRNNLTRVENPDNLGERDSDREYDWSRHVGKYNIGPSFWDSIKRAFPAEQLLPSLNSVDLLNREQLTVYNLIVNHYSRFLAGKNPPQLRVNLDGVAGTGKTYVLLQASKKVEEMATIAGVRDPILRAAPTGIASHNFHGRTLHALFRILVKIPAGGLTQKLSRANLGFLQALFADCQYLIIDEKSMIGIKFLGLIDQRLREIFPSRQDEPYAGINIFVCGDFHQLPPIGAAVMYSNAPSRNADHLRGQQSYRALDKTARLTQLMRQDGEDDETIQFCRALRELRTYEVSQQSWQLLSTRVQNRLTPVEVASFDNAVGK